VPYELVASDRENAEVVAAENAGNFAPSHASTPVKAWDGHAMSGEFQHLGASSRAMRNLANPTDRFLGQLRADGRQPADSKQSCAASGLLSVVTNAVAYLTASLLPNFAIQRQGEQFADTETGHNQDGKRRGSQLIPWLDRVLAINIRETVQHGFGWQPVPAGLLARYRVTVEVFHAGCLRGVIDGPAKVPAGQEPGEHEQAHHALVCGRLRPMNPHQQLSLTEVFFRQGMPSERCGIAAASRENRFPKNANSIQSQPHVAWRVAVENQPTLDDARKIRGQGLIVRAMAREVYISIRPVDRPVL
jgi:hypothetical protein